jgi:glycosyltransferase involved in cell wall biosynthesis
VALLINGRVERYSDMLVRVIAKEWPGSRILVPRGHGIPEKVHGLDVIPVGSFQGHLWEQLSLPRAVGPKDMLISPANTGPWRLRQHVVVIHDLAVIHHPEWFDRRFAAWYTFLLPRLARNAARVITVSRTSAADITTTFGVPGSKVDVVPPYVLERTSAVAEHGIDPPYYLMVASRDPRKGHDRAVDWWSSFAKPPFKFVLVGRAGPAFKGMNTTGLRDMLWLEDVDDARLSALYAGAIALLHPSRSEGFGLPVLEALAHGCPVIASDLPVLRESFGDAIIFAEIGGNSEMGAAMAILNEPEQRASTISRGSRKAAEFDMARTTTALHNALDPLLNT